MVAQIALGAAAIPNWMERLNLRVIRSLWVGNAEPAWR